MTNKQSIFPMNASDLTPAHVAVWRGLQDSNDALSSPFLCVEFATTAAQVRERIEVAVVDQAGRTVGFFPFHRDRRNVARPVAGSFTAFQGMICSPGLALHAAPILDGCGLSAWHFDSLLACQLPFRHDQLAQHDSPYMDLSEGFEAYRIERRRAGSREVQEAMRKSRKLEREVAALRFEADCRDPLVLETLIRWKQQQLRAMRLPDAFADPWVIPLLERIMQCRSDRFRGLLSAVYAGDELLAASLGMRSAHVLHGWVTAYNWRFRRYSPGLILLIHLAQAAHRLGIHRIDMGRGEESFKRSFGSGAVPVAEGLVDRRLVSSVLHKSWIVTKERLRGTALDAPARRLIQRARRMWPRPAAK